MLNLSILLEDSARRYPDRAAVVLGDTRLTYAQVDAAANQVANLLVSTGIEPGDRVALTCPNLPYFPVIYYGILKAGAVVVPLNVLNKARENTYFLDDSGAKAYFCFQGTAELTMGDEGYAGFGAAEGCDDFFLVMADPAAPASVEGTTTFASAVKDQSTTFSSVVTHETDTAVILYTSGTTGQSKGAELSHSQPGDERPDLQPAVRRRARHRHAPADAAAVPLVRLDGADERRLLDGRRRWCCCRASTPSRRWR